MNGLITWAAKLVMPQVASSNNYYWDISYVFGVRDYGASSTPKVSGEHVGWNYVFDPVSGAWDLATQNGLVAGPALYTYKDPSDLFKANW